MKRKIAILVFIAVFVIATPVLAGKREPIGTKIGLFGESPVHFDAGEPFYISHGWANPSDITGVGLFRFALEVDGTFVKESFVMRSAESGDPDILTWIWVFNFPEGMTGTHTFTGHWTGSCQGLVDMEVETGPCEKPNGIIETVRTRTVIFE